MPLCKCYLFVCFFHRLLLELLELLFDKFNAVATAHSVVLGYLQDSVGTQPPQQEEIKLYDMADVWVKIQDVLQVMALYKGYHLDWRQQYRVIVNSDLNYYLREPKLMRKLSMKGDAVSFYHL